MSNYRPVSCLPAVSRKLEKIEYEPLSDYFEKNNAPGAIKDGKTLYTAKKEIKKYVNMVPL